MYITQIAFIAQIVRGEAEQIKSTLHLEDE